MNNCGRGKVKEQFTQMPSHSDEIQGEEGLGQLIHLERRGRRHVMSTGRPKRKIKEVKRVPGPLSAKSSVDTPEFCKRELNALGRIKGEGVHEDKA